MEVLQKIVLCVLTATVLTACGGGSGDANSSAGAGVTTENTNWDNAQWDKATWK